MEEEKLRFLLQGVFGTVEGHAAFEAVLFERDEKSIDRFTRIAFSSETKKNVEEEGGGWGGGGERGKKDYCQLVIEGIGVLTREIRL